ncbi:MAG: class I SAM-dependent rRNA methyltransferase [Pseudomonadota bacterium]
MVMVLQTVTLSARAAKRLNEGVLWISEQDIVGRKPKIPCIARVFDRQSRVIAHAFLSPGSRYYLRIITRHKAEIDRRFWADQIRKALNRRQPLEKQTDTYRVVHSESDGMPSIIIDRYNDIVSLQITSQGAQTVRDDIVAAIEDVLEPRAIIERSSRAMSRSEGIAGKDKILCGDSSIAMVREKDMRFELDVLSGQKTGAYLDYRSIRMKACELSRGKTLDAFCYQGWLACQIAAKAKSVVAVDCSKSALEAARRNAEINSQTNIEFIKADVFNYIKNCKEQFDFVHMDPPAMAKNRAETAQAISGYRKLFNGGIKLLKQGGILMISSCSHKITQRILEETSLECLKKSGRKGAIIWRGKQDIDHPVLDGLSESLYLKALAIKFDD